MKITHVVLFALTIAAQSSFSHAEKPLYLDILLGQADQEERIAGAPQIKGDELSIGIRLGYRIIDQVDFVLIDQLAIELGYHDFGEHTDSISSNGFTLNETIETTSFNLGFKSTVHVSERVDLNARIGAFRWDYRIDQVSAFNRIKGDDDGIDIYLGVGASFQLTDFLDVGVEYTFLDHEVRIGPQTFDRDVRNASFIISYGL